MTKTAKKKQQEEVSVVSTVSPDIVLENVFEQLGKPKDLCRISPSYTRATPITSSTFRVNIYREDPYAHLSDSFYVWVNQSGKIKKSEPAITRRYDEA
jgi:hypothetical protein